MTKIKITYLNNKFSTQRFFFKYCTRAIKYIFNTLRRIINLSLNILKLSFKIFCNMLHKCINHSLKILALIQRISKYCFRLYHYFFKKNLYLKNEILSNLKLKLQNKIKLIFYKNKKKIYLSIIRKSQHKNQVCTSYLKNANLIGGSSIYIFNGQVFHPESIDVNIDRFAEEYRGFFIYNNIDNNIEILYNSIVRLPFSDLTINLMGGTANNYAHWISEILPRLFYILNNNTLNKINILVNQDIHNNLISTIKRLVKNLKSVHIILVENGVSLIVKKLCNVSNIGYCQFEPRNRDYPPYLYLNSNLIRSMALKLGEEIEPKKYKKIFLERSSTSRNIINNHELKEFLEKNGFIVINTNNMTFEDQVSYFKGARVVMGATGASFANCIFCDDSANIYILTTTNKHHLFSYWPSLLGDDRLNIKYIKQSIYSENEDISASFKVNLDSLLSTLN